MPWSGMKSWVEWGATTGCVLMRAMIRLSGVALNSDLLREGLFWARYGRHRPADRCAAPAGCAAVVPEHRAAGGAERAGGQAARRPARGRRRDPRLYRPGRPGPLRLGHARDRGALLRGAHGGRRGARRRRAPPRGRGRLHGGGRGERGRPRPRPRHRAPRGDARAPARPARDHPDADAGRALDAVRAAVPRVGAERPLRRASASGAAAGPAGGAEALHLGLGQLALARGVGDALAEEAGGRDRDGDPRPDRDLLLLERLAQVELGPRAGGGEALLLVRAALLLLLLLLGLAGHDDRRAGLQVLDRERQQLREPREGQRVDARRRGAPRQRAAPPAAAPTATATTARPGRDVQAHSCGVGGGATSRRAIVERVGAGEPIEGAVEQRGSALVDCADLAGRGCAHDGIGQRVTVAIRAAEAQAYGRVVRHVHAYVPAHRREIALEGGDGPSRVLAGI